eukprot:5983871-Lingulodinium_polyedra.AAC.1
MPIVVFPPRLPAQHMVQAMLPRQLGRRRQSGLGLPRQPHTEWLVRQATQPQMSEHFPAQA